MAVDPLTPVADVSLRANLTGIPGLEVAAGLKAVRGNLDRYTRLLAMFAQGHANDMATLRAHWATGEIAEARRLAHTLKGVAATLGAEALRRRALELERVLRESAPAVAIEAGIGAVEAVLTPLLAAIREFSGAETARAPVAVDEARARDVLAQLESLLAADDTRVNQVWLESAPLLEVVLGPLAAPIKRAIDYFDYSNALRLLRDSDSQIRRSPSSSTDARPEGE
jgi:two-component system sensor histidine kinase/response regulator